MNSSKKMVKMLGVSAVIVTVLLTVLWVTCPVIFQNDDDKVLLYLTAGFTTGTNEIGTIFGASFWYGFIALLYKITSHICWYTIVELAVTALSLLAICHSIMLSISKRAYLLGGLTFAFLFISVFCYFSAALQYTATAGLLGGAAACMALCYKYMESKGEKIYNVAATAALVTVAFGIRKQFGEVSLTAVLIVLAFEIIFVGKESRLELVKNTLIIVLVFAIAFVSNSIYEEKSGIAEFNDYYAQAGKWIDYPHLSYDEDVDGVYNSVGWDQWTYKMASNWFFMDEAVTKDNFEVINSAYTDEGLSKKEILQRAVNLLIPSKFCNVQMALWILLLLVVNVISIVKKKSLKHMLAMDVLFLMFMLLSVHFLLQGRYPLRVYQSLLYIYFVPSILIALQHFSDYSTDKANIIMLCVLAVVLLGVKVKIPDANMYRITRLTCNDQNRVRDIKLGESLESYAMEHPDQIFVYDMTLTLPAGAFTVYEDTVPNNVLFWGGWIYNTPLYHKQLKSCGLDSLYSDDFIGDKVVICSLELPEDLIDYMYARYPECKCDIIDEFDGIVFYQFTK